MSSFVISITSRSIYIPGYLVVQSGSRHFRTAYAKYYQCRPCSGNLTLGLNSVSTIPKVLRFSPNENSALRKFPKN